MKFDLFQIDAFTDHLFSGNPACIVPLKEWLPDDLMLKIARENAVAETAFFVGSEGRYHLRWFTPELEMDLCGHATLATSHAIKTILGYEGDRIVYDSASGELTVTVENDLYTLDFPSRKPEPTHLPDVLKRALNLQPDKVLMDRDYVLVYQSEQEVRDIVVNQPILDELDMGTGGVIVTARGQSADFVSRFFSPNASILEDPVTGSAHCSLIPYWSEELNKVELSARQLSERGGVLFCRDRGDRVDIAGNATTYFIGSFSLDL